MEPLLSIRNLTVGFQLREGEFDALRGVNLDVPQGRSIGVVGESGCGKSMTARAILRLLPRRARITEGQIMLHGRTPDEPVRDLAKGPPNSAQMRTIRGREIAMIFQEPMACLSPVHKIGDQVGEVVRIHQTKDRAEIDARVKDILRLVGVPVPDRVANAYPFELSGGLRQRAMIAMALACQPRLLIADEPTTALDVTIQAQVLDLINDLRCRLGMAMIMITHDLGVVANVTDEVVVMYLGSVVERAPVKALFKRPLHPYTQGLLKCVPRLGGGNDESLNTIAGTVPAAFNRPSGCPFHPRCPERIAGVCDVGPPPAITEIEREHFVACHLYGEPVASHDGQRSHLQPVPAGGAS